MIKEAYELGQAIALSEARLEKTAGMDRVLSQALHKVMKGGKGLAQNIDDAAKEKIVDFLRRVESKPTLGPATGLGLLGGGLGAAAGAAYAPGDELSGALVGGLAGLGAGVGGGLGYRQLLKRYSGRYNQVGNILKSMQPTKGVKNNLDFQKGVDKLVAMSEQAAKETRHLPGLFTGIGLGAGTGLGIGLDALKD